MNVHSISTNDTTPQHNFDFDFESLSGMSSPVLTEFSDIVAPIDNGDDLQSLPPDFSDNDITDPGSPADMLPVLDSFVSIIEHLPGLVLENNSYHVKRPLLKAELKQLRSYTRRIRELILTDARSIDYPSVAPETLARLALIQDPTSPFLPSLESLRIVDADEALAYYLFFCITPSLASLEISQIPSARQITISCFLEELVLNAPQLSNITLGPGRLSASSLQSSLQFVRLRHLHIIDAADSLDFEFLRNVSSLPELESFVIDARTAEYKQRLLQSDAVSLAPTNSSLGHPPFVDDQMPIVTNIDSATPFHQLKRLTIIANVVLMGDLVYYLFPQGVKEVSLTLVQNGLPLQLPSHWDKRWPEASATAHVIVTDASAEAPEQGSISQDGVEAFPDDRSGPEVLSALSGNTSNPFLNSTSTTSAEEPQAADPSVVAPEVIPMAEQPIETSTSVPAESSTSAGKKKKGKKPTSSCEQCLKREEEKRHKAEEAEARKRLAAEEKARREQEEERLKAEEEARERIERTTEAWLTTERAVREEQERISNIIEQTAFFGYVIEEILTVGNPDTFVVDRLEMAPVFDFDPIPSSIEFPSPTFRMLLSYPTLKELQFYHWTLASVNESLVDLAAIPPALPMSMEKLQLPVDAALNSGIMITTLHQISRYYPRLTYLECLIRQIPPAMDSPLDLGTEFIPHGLKVLSVGGGSPTARDKINAATDLSLLFPYLETIETHGGYDRGDWEYVYSLVKMCQTVRRDERLRHQGAQ